VDEVPVSVHFKFLADFLVSLSAFRGFIRFWLCSLLLEPKLFRICLTDSILKELLGFLPDD
jgi:hypothetical protein